MKNELEIIRMNARFKTWEFYATAITIGIYIAGVLANVLN